MPTDAIDKSWFAQKLAQNNQSMRDLASHLGLDVSAVSRTFSGNRKMQLNEASAIAQFLRVPSTEVLRHVGVSVEAESDETCILLAAAVNEEGQVEILKEARSLPQRVIARSQVALKMHVGLGIIAAQIRASTGALAIFDDAVILFCATEIVDETVVGKLAICRSSNGEQMLCRVEQARKTGEARVVLASGKISELILHTATPVLAIIP